jgi:ubiquinone/menaquinone biosynthesis C-methylase UbiE
MISPLDRLSFFTRQGLRVAWYMGHYFATQDFRHAGKEAPPPHAAQQKPPRESSFDLFAELAALFRRDFDNVAQGFYPLPRDHDGSLAEVLSLSRAFFADVPLAAERKQARAGREIYHPDLAREFPDYFLQNFHYQTGGYLTDESARLYDTQVEVLFSGTANAMRRQCIVPIAEFLRGRNQRQHSLLDVACGTGRFLRFLKEAFPRLNLTGLDLSQPYLEEARRHLSPYSAVLEVGTAESLPFPSSSFDLVTSIYLFHEVPHEVRRQIATEFARVLKPSGLLVFMDSLQLGDRPGFDGLLEAFPRNFHEPYFGDYLRDDLAAVFAQAGLRPKGTEIFFLSKRIVCEKL